MIFTGQLPVPHKKHSAEEEQAPRSGRPRAHISGLTTQNDLPLGPRIGIEHIVIDGRLVSVRELSVVEKSFGRLLHFEADLTGQRPPILLVAPLSGMRAEILYDMILGLLPWHDVYCLAWKDAADVPAGDGPFRLEDNITYVVETIRYLGAGTHVIGLCQSALPALAAAAILSEDLGRPATLTLLGGKLDTRINPTRVDLLTRSLPPAWFENCAISTVPASRRGHGRRVYPGSTELMMLSTYLFRHCASGGELLAKIFQDDGSDAVGHPFLRLFCQTYDVPAEFFLDTVALVFQQSALAEGHLAWQGTTITPERITGTALLTIEGEADDISGPGQTRIAHDLCEGIPAERRGHLLCPHTGHVGLFFGSRWRQEVLPHISRFIRENGN
nr:polyhydroxyalkanoate depolymerase [Ancylobacter dichloromethanicus]